MNDPVKLLEVRDLIQSQLTENPNIEFGGSAGVYTDGSAADVDVLIDGKMYNIQIKPRNK